jgi:hypothetical protein
MFIERSEPRRSVLDLSSGEDVFYKSKIKNDKRTATRQKLFGEVFQEQISQTLHTALCSSACGNNKVTDVRR